MGMMLRRHSTPLSIAKDVKAAKVEKPMPPVSMAKVKVEVAEEITENVTYTRTEINRMNKEALTQLAINEGLENAEELSGNQIKKMLIEKYDC